MKKYLVLAGLVMSSLHALQAQTDTLRDELATTVTQRIYSLPYYSYGKGLGFTSPDSLYQMNIRFRIQNRAAYTQNGGAKGVIDGQVRRLRLRLDGYVGNPKFTYALQLSFAPGDLGGAVQDGENLNIIRDAVVFYSLTEKWSIGLGQTKLPGNRQRVNSSGALQLTDRSINNALFNIDRDFGIQVNYIHQNHRQFSYNFKGAVSQGEGRNITENTDMNLAYTGKAELYPMGAFKKNGEYFEGDILYEETPKMMISGVYQFNNKAKNSQGQLGDVLFDKRDLHTVFADLIFKYRGFAFMAAYMQRYTKFPLTFNPVNWLENDYVIAGHGYDFQSSYYLPGNYEITGRFSSQYMQEPVKPYLPDARQFTIGLTKYIWEHAFKIQGEATYNVQTYFNDTRKDNWYFRFQIEMGI